MKVKLMGTTSIMVPFDGKYQMYTRQHIFVVVFTISEILAYKMFDLENLSQGRIIQNDAMQWQISTFIKVIYSRFNK